ncbi:MAG: tRNA (adenosine(37)-N6)-threonylcarbamoyltransferase complex ATPase subunit type 1 TsaE [Anaerolineales bacterium]|nr:tRNA (adenosine(37)-N6)-threonylcarbamoyltransferase complex ATPase subunit type 1 TsaE [Anaerolineales bacterium]MDW8447614.1 tRNA (adenosine(37)-N6)-threonylcarbamoyltransferase complex ATPase subunit type 1 TsaE [Anaerolineales bacterium]
MEFISRSPAQTRRLGARIGALLQPGDVVCLSGELGSGKTTLVQGIAAGWGSPDPANSPTFVLVNIYRHPVGKRLYHLDAYRLSSPAEAIDLDLEAMLESGPLVVEWADRIQAVLPRENLWITLRWIDEEQRDMVFKANGERYLELLTQLRRQIYGVP